MSVEAVKKYLEENKAKYPRETLAGELRGGGYPEDEIQAGLQAVYGVGEAAPHASFWDFRSVRVYRSKGEKFIDVLAGFFAPWISGVFFGFFSGLFGIGGPLFYPLRFVFMLFPIFFLIVDIWAIFYLWRRRHYFALGLLANFVIAALIIGFAILLFFSFRGFGRNY